MDTRIIFVVLFCASSSIAQFTISVTSTEKLAYSQDSSVPWQTGNGTCTNITSPGFLSSSLQSGQTSSTLSITGWVVNVPQALQNYGVYHIQVNITYSQSSSGTEFSLIQFSSICGQALTDSNYTINYADSTTQLIDFTVERFSLSQIMDFSLHLQRESLDGTGSGNYSIHCIRIRFYAESTAGTAMCSPSPSASPSTTPSVTPSTSVSSSVTPSASVSPTVTPTNSITPSITPSVSVSSSITPSATPTITPSPSITPSISVTPSITPSISISPSISKSPNPPNKSSSDNSTVIGAAVGGIVGGVALIGLVAFLVVRKKRSSKRGEDRNSLELSRSPSSSGYAAYSTNNDSKPLNKKGTISNELYIDDVKLKGLLGRGKFGEVYEGIWHGATPVACKRLKQEDQTEFENEIRLLTMLNHPNVVRCLGIWIDPSQETYMVLELLRLGSLADFLRKKETQAKLTGTDLIEMCANIASGMIYLEQKNIVHRDLGARNLLVTETDGKYVVKVSDFGLSRQVDDSDAVYSSKEGVFPIKWSPPEVINYRKFTSKSDVWSLGVTMWEVFEFGKMPYPSMTNQQCMEEVMKGYRLPQPQNCPDRVFACMKACWQEDPERRPNFKSIHETLLSILEDTHVKKKLPEENFDFNNNNSARNSLYNTDSSFSNRNQPEIYNSRLFEN